MESYLISDLWDLITPDGEIVSIQELTPTSRRAKIRIVDISPQSACFTIDSELLFFNLKSTLAQLGINASTNEILLERTCFSAEVDITLTAIGPIARALLPLLTAGCFIGKLFAKDPRRRVRDPEYLLRMFGRSDRQGRPLLSLGALQGSDALVLEKIEGRTVAYLALQEGVIEYSEGIYGLLPTLVKALQHRKMNTRVLLQLHQHWEEGAARTVAEDKILLVKTLPLHIRTVFGRVASELLPEGVHHTSACILDPTTKASGDVYELFGSSKHELTDIPLEFYTLEPHREHVFFSDRDQLQATIENPSALFRAFETAPNPMNLGAAVFVVKGEQLLSLSEKDWITRDVQPKEFPGLIHPSRQALMVQRYVHEQPSYPFLDAIEKGLITSQGVLFTRYFPTPLMKEMLLSDSVLSCLKGIYFQQPSLSHGDFFSHEDRSFLLDLAKFAIPVYWVDRTSEKVLQYTPKPEKDAGMFVPLNAVETFQKATAFGIYGSNLLAGPFEEELTKLLLGLQNLQSKMHHPLLSKTTPIALVTGGGPGVMEVGNRVAKSLQILSCANIVDFSAKAKSPVHEQKQNPYIDAKMTYRIDRLVERQAEFNLDFPIILMGGIGTDFEFALEEVRRKVSPTSPTPVLLFGEVEYWRDKITSRFQRNLKQGTICGSEWVSNCFYCIQNATQGLHIYEQYFSGTLKIGKSFPMSPEGFISTP